MNLYKIDAEIKQLLYSEVDMSGEISEDTARRLNELMRSEKSKIIGCGHWINKRKREIEQANAQIKALEETIRTETSKIDNLKKLVVNVLDTWNNGRVEDGLFKMSTRKGGISVNIIDESKIGVNCIVKTVVRQIDKKLIKSIIQNGGEVSGVELKEGSRGLTIKGE